MARDRATDTAKLLAAAGTVFRQKGYRNATIDDIAEAAKISRPTVYKYTKSKQHLLDLMVDEITSRLDSGLRSVLDSEASPEEKLEQYISVQVDAAIANSTYYAIVFSEEVELSSEGTKRFREWAHQVTAEFGDLIDHFPNDIAPTLAHGNATALANLILSMFTSLHRWYHPDGPVTRDDLILQAHSFIDGGLRRTANVGQSRNVAVP